MVKDQVVIAKTNAGTYVTVTQQGSHEETYAILLKNNEWFCTDHDARFTLDGGGLNKEGKRGLTIYRTALEGDILRVYS